MYPDIEVRCTDNGHRTDVTSVLGSGAERPYGVRMGEYFSAFFPQLWALATAGSLFGLDELCSRYWPAARERLDRVPHAVRRRIEYILIIVAIFYAGYVTWDGEHRERLRAETAMAKAGQHVERHLSEQQQKRLLDVLRPIANSLPKIHVQAGYSAEEQQYAAEFMRVLHEAKVMMVNEPTRGDFFANPISTNSTDVKGLTLGVGNKHRPPASAVRFFKAMEQAGFRVSYVTHFGYPEDAEEFSFAVFGP